MQSHIKRISNGDYNIEKRGHLYAYIERHEGKEEELVPIINEIVITRAEPVSYTHLDVYKRQHYMCAFSMDIVFLMLFYVYKSALKLL